MPSDPEAESESELESESIRSPYSESELEHHHHDSAPLSGTMGIPIGQTKFDGRQRRPSELFGRGALKEALIADG